MYHKGLLGWRYDSRCNYMITLVTEPRANIFGTLREWGVERTEEGRAVYDAWQAVEARFPGVRATYNAIMPDHFHGIVYITEEGAAVLDEVVAFFAGEVERRIGRRVWCALWRESVCLAKGQLHRQINYILSNAKRRWIKENNPGLFKKVMAIARGGRVVQLLAEGMGRYYKPGGADFDLCADGRLLQLSPFAPREAGAARENYGKARFEWLNLAAKAIGDLSAGFSRADLGKTRTASVQQQGGGL